jgi:methionyl-tRNA formyltransferase
MRTVFLGTSEFAASVLRRLAESAHRPSLVITRPDRPRGRGRKLSSPPVAEAARELQIELEQPSSVNDEAARATIAASRPEAVCVAAFGALIKEPLLSDYWILNVHPSLLPRWRGAAPIERAIMAGDQRTGVSIIRLTEGLDSGPICAQQGEPIGDGDTYGTLATRLQQLGGELLVDTLDRRSSCTEQPEEGVTYAEKIRAEDRVLEPSRSAAQLERTVRALNPHIGAQVRLSDGTLLAVHQARVLRDGGPPAGVLSVNGGTPVLGCAAGALELLVVQPPGRRPMSGAEFVRGYKR